MGISFSYSEITSLCSGDLFYLPSCTITDVHEGIYKTLREEVDGQSQIKFLFDQALENVRKEVELKDHRKLSSVTLDSGNVLIACLHGGHVSLKIFFTLSPIELYQKFVSCRDVGDYKHAFGYLKRVADKTRDKYHQFKLGIWYEEGRGTDVNYVEAAKNYQFASDQELPAAHYRLGICFRYGEGVDKDLSMALHYLTLATKQGDPDALYSVGDMYQRGEGFLKNIEKGINCWEEAAAKGHSRAQCQLGKYYIEQDANVEQINKGIQYLQLAVENEEPVAQFLLGRQYLSGSTLPENIHRGFKLLKLSADQGYRYAELDVGIAYYEGSVVPQDMDAAYDYFYKAAQQGLAIAQFKLANCYNTGCGVSKNSDKAFYWCRKAAKNKYAQAQFELGRHYLSGSGCSVNLTLATENFKLAAQQGYIDGLQLLEQCKDSEVESQQTPSRVTTQFPITSSLGKSSSDSSSSKERSCISNVSTPTPGSSQEFVGRSVNTPTIFRRKSKVALRKVQIQHFVSRSCSEPIASQRRNLEGSIETGTMLEQRTLPQETRSSRPLKRNSYGSPNSSPLSSRRTVSQPDNFIYAQSSHRSSFPPIVETQDDNDVRQYVETAGYSFDTASNVTSGSSSHNFVRTT